MNKNLSPLMLVAAGTFACGYQCQAQEASLEYSTEWQTDFRTGFNWVNLLKLSGSLTVTDHLKFDASTISIAKTRGDALVEDRQGYSNIEEENLPLALSVLGAEVNWKRSTFFLGIRNVNEDYFTSPLTGFFINSSCGIYPTLAANYDIANYPLASWCVHYAVEWDAIRLQTSLYSGRGYNRFGGSESVFRFCPARDGIFSITSAEYNRNGNIYNLGFGIYHGVHSGDADGLAEAPAKKKTSFTPWFNVEQKLSEQFELMFQGSVSTVRDGCRYYAGAGAKFSAGRFEPGIFTDYAWYSDGGESATEFTCRITLTDKFFIQPTLHLIYTDNRLNTVGLMRLTFCM